MPTIISAVVVLVLLWKVFSLDSQIRNLGASDSGALQEALKRVQAELALAKELAPGLGEYMSTIQLHAGKLWFAAKASNWELAAYELHELEESGHRFIQIVRSAAPPVTNQKWELSAK